MNLKNYSSEVPSDRSISRIERKLVEIGATAISKDYQDGVLTAIRFMVNTNGNSVVFQLPAKVDRVFQVLWNEVKRPQAGTRQKVKEQAERTAWKIICDWVEVQASMILLEQADTLQIFLPYAMVRGDQTLYENLQENGFKLLNGPA